MTELVGIVVLVAAAAVTIAVDRWATRRDRNQ